MSLNVFSPHKSEFRFPPVVPRAGCLPPTFSTSTTFHHCDLCGDQADMAIVPPASHTVSCVCALARPLSLSVMASVPLSVGRTPHSGITSNVTSSGNSFLFSLAGLSEFPSMLPELSQVFYNNRLRGSGRFFFICMSSHLA